MGRLYYEDFFKLNTNPFGETPDPVFFYASQTHQNALQELNQSLIQGKGFSLLTGEVGMGKTLVSRILLETTHLKESKTDSALILYPNCTESELLSSVCNELAIEVSRGTYAGHKQDLDRLNDFLIQNIQTGRKTVLVIDEAQNMPARTLETVRLLSNLETSNQKLIHIIFCAQPEFNTRLSQPDFRQLKQRIATHVKLNAFDVVDTEKYIKHRIERAGGSNFLRFDAEACRLIHKMTSGIPRNINQRCEQLLTLAKRRGTRLISKALVKETAPASSHDQWLGRLWKRAEKSIA